MIKTLHKSEDASLTLKINPDFRGILRGFAHDVSEGCSLNGELLLNVHHHIKIKALDTTLTGICQVSFRTTNSMGVPTPDGSESRSIYKKRIVHFNEIADSTGNEHALKSTEFEPGTYKFPFSFNIPPTIPQTFKGKYGSIEYELSATATRSMFTPDIHTACPVIIRRCLMNNLDPLARDTQVIHGKMHPDIVTYSATAPSMVYCEGGLLALGLNIQLKDPTKYSLKMVTCGLQEKIKYRTTGKSSLINQASYCDEVRYPLGCSTFFPSKHPEYNPTELHNYNAIFRLYPRVHTDNSASLIIVRHFLVIRMIISTNHIVSKKKSTDTNDTSINNGGKSFLTHLSLKQHNSSSSLSVVSPINMRFNTEHSSSPSLSRSSSLSETSFDSTSSDSLSSSYSVSTSLEQMNAFQTNTVKVSNLKLHEELLRGNNRFRENEVGSSEVNNNDDDNCQIDRHLGHSLTMHHHFNPFKFHRDLEEGAYECHLSVPIIVTSREEYKEGSVPALPDYETIVDEPPSYLAAIQLLPPVPIYPSNTDMNLQQNTNN
ncbi:uncharacterized protein BX663DRAFT_524953, partial [Cokeromyces recurvatus]|uniref:uncharacterized protein n=1 Tax=Cokeromyces recurvatus TaxID=90255 RepID=UPI0022204B59